MPVRALIVLALACSALTLGSGSSARAFCRLTTAMPLPGDRCAEDGAVLAWHRQCIGYTLAPRTARDLSDAAIREAVARSFSTWNGVHCDGRRVGLELVQTAEPGACTEVEYNTHESNANTIAFVADWRTRELPEESFGLTLVWHDHKTGEIFDADMQLNETQGPFAICDGTCPAGTVDLQNLITHEAGHFLGLGHSEHATATMSARAELAETEKRSLIEDDNAALCSIYGAFPAPRCDAKDFLPNHGFSPVCAAPGPRMETSSCSAVTVTHDRSPQVAFWLAALAVLQLVRRRAHTRATQA